MYGMHGQGECEANPGWMVGAAGAMSRNKGHCRLSCGTCLSTLPSGTTILLQHAVALNDAQALQSTCSTLLIYDAAYDLHQLANVNFCMHLPADS